MVRTGPEWAGTVSEHSSDTARDPACTPMTSAWSGVWTCDRERIDEAMDWSPVGRAGPILYKGLGHLMAELLALPFKSLY